MAILRLWRHTHSTQHFRVGDMGARATRDLHRLVEIDGRRDVILRDRVSLSTAPAQSSDDALFIAMGKETP